MHKVIRGHVISYGADPLYFNDARYDIADGAIYVVDGHIHTVDDYSVIRLKFPDVPVEDYTGHYILPGFIDTHTHFTQVQVVASFGTHLLDWLQTYTFPAEQKYSNPEFSSVMARSFLDVLISHGTTSAAVYGSVHPQSVDAIMAAAYQRSMRLAAGKVMMDRNAPDYLLDTAQSGFDQTQKLINRWSGVGRLSYLVTPRFAITSTEAQLEAAGELMKMYPEIGLQTHLSETEEEVAFVKQLFPWSRDYVDVYDRYGLVTDRSLFGHCLYLSERERVLMQNHGSVAILCPTSNMFLGSGFPDRKALCHPKQMRLALATDIGGGTSYSMLGTAAMAYKALKLQGQLLSANQAFYMLTAGNAAAMGWEQTVGQIKPGYEADLVVLNPAATRDMRLRRKGLEMSVDDDLFMMMIMGDDRTIVETYIMGHPVKSVL